MGRKAGMTSSPHGLYAQGYTRATMAGTNRRQPARGSQSVKTGAESRFHREGSEHIARRSGISNVKFEISDGRGCSTQLSKAQFINHHLSVQDQWPRAIAAILFSECVRSCPEGHPDYDLHLKREAAYDKLEDGTYARRIPSCPGS